jgi:hypothetical protein
LARSATCSNSILMRGLSYHSESLIFAGNNRSLKAMLQQLVSNQSQYVDGLFWCCDPWLPLKFEIKRKCTHRRHNTFSTIHIFYDSTSYYVGECVKWCDFSFKKWGGNATHAVQTRFHLSDHDSSVLSPLSWVNQTKFIISFQCHNCMYRFELLILVLLLSIHALLLN